MGIDVGKFLKAPEYEIIITTYRDVFQAEALECNRLGDKYQKLSAVILMNEKDMKRMGFKEGDKVKLTNDHGSVVVRVKQSKKDDVEGIAYMINSPWCNVLVSYDKDIPEFKYIKAKISLSSEDITPIEELIG